MGTATGSSVVRKTANMANKLHKPTQQEAGGIAGLEQQGQEQHGRKRPTFSEDIQAQTSTHPAGSGRPHEAARFLL